MNAYVWWYIRRFYGPIDDNGNVTKRGYAISQYARFIRPGFVRISATSSPQDEVFLTAYKNGSKVVIVCINNDSQPHDQKFILRKGSVSTFTPYVTSETKNCAQQSEVSVTNSIFTATLDAKSVTTFVSN
jgi:glucuronoarabinoxylan endo-1,4-beta-xylanase